MPDHGFLARRFGEEGPKSGASYIDPIDGHARTSSGGGADLGGAHRPRGGGTVTAGVVLNPRAARCSGRTGGTGRGTGTGACGSVRLRTAHEADRAPLRPAPAAPGPTGTPSCGWWTGAAAARGFRRLLWLRPGRRGQGRLYLGGRSQAVDGRRCRCCWRRRAAGSPTSRARHHPMTARCWPPTPAARADPGPAPSVARSVRLEPAPTDPSGPPLAAAIALRRPTTW